MKKLTTEEFIEKAINIHGNKYDYSKVEYVNNRTKVCIICTEHGEFWQTPHEHLRGCGCPSCHKTQNGKKQKLSAAIKFLDKAKSIHNEKYEYGEYLGDDVLMDIHCPIHGWFKQRPNNHIRGSGCDKCARIKNGLKKIEKHSKIFIEKSNTIHNQKYIYTNVKYIGKDKNVEIICPIHGAFQQSPNNHLHGQGCPKCKRSHLEIEIRNFLTENNIKFKEQYRSQWLGLQSLDFYLPEHNVGIECQGEQHFNPKDFFGGQLSFQYIKGCDKKKYIKCKNNNVHLIYYSNLNIVYPYKVFTDKSLLLKEIIKGDSTN